MAGRTNADDDRPRLGISTCLLGESVRYDGGHKRDRFLTDTFGKYVDWVPVCPEVECGLPIPRESMHLEGDPDDPRLVTSRTNVDLTDKMKTWARKRIRELGKENLSGFIFKANSPSSGMERVKVFDEKGMPHKVGSGVFARMFMDHFSLLPVEEEGRLHDPVLRENFIESVFCLKRYRDATGTRRSARALIDFHAAHKLQLMAHSPKILKEMGQLVARQKELKRSELFDAYEALLIRALRTKPTPGKNANVLQHALGYFKKELTPDEKREALEVIESYRKEIVPLIVPVTLIGHYARKYEPEYLSRQTFLSPHPGELKLRNHA
ncbi:MAG: DUF1722 domain-containing protein [Candidatus Eisenbacteria bacterium]|nr:DUF1722 domain-containing protein [Candidatus Eisenbacteria bacterium]